MKVAQAMMDSGIMLFLGMESTVDPVIVAGKAYMMKSKIHMAHLWSWCMSLHLGAYMGMMQRRIGDGIAEKHWRMRKRRRMRSIIWKM
jgi:hypothetical protein